MRPPEGGNSLPAIRTASSSGLGRGEQPAQAVPGTGWGASKGKGVTGKLPTDQGVADARTTGLPTESAAASAAQGKAGPIFKPMRRVLKPACTSGLSVIPGEAASSSAPSVDGGAGSPVSSVNGGGSFNEDGAAWVLARAPEGNDYEEGAEQERCSSKPAPGQASPVLVTPEPKPRRTRIVQDTQGRTRNGSPSQALPHVPSQQALQLLMLSHRPGLHPEGARRLHSALQSLMSSDLPDDQKQVVVEGVLSALAIMQAHAARGTEGAAVGTKLACAAVIAVSLVSLVCSLWVLFMAMEAGIIALQ